MPVLITVMRSEI